MIIGYARISTKKQNVERQIRNLKKYDENIYIFQEAFSSATLDRPEFQKMLKFVYTQLQQSKKITIVFDSVSRMSRDSVEGTELYFKLESDGVELVFLNEPHINTEQYKKAIDMSIPDSGNKMIEAILDGIRQAFKIKAKQDIELAFEQAEKELLDIRKRTKQGILEAKISGKQIGTKKGSTRKSKRGEEIKEKLLKHSRLFGGNMTDREFAQTYNCSATTIHKYKCEIREELKKTSI